MDLIDAVIKNNFIAVSDLLSKNADPDKADDVDNITPLHHAAQNDSFESAVLLINAGADTSAVTIDGETPLKIAEFHKSERVTKLLLEISSIFSKRKIQ